MDHHVARTLRMLADQVEREGLATVGDTWMEMVAPYGTNLMFRRDVFDETGGWEVFEQFFSGQPRAWSEDVGVCVALKSVADAFVDVSRIVLHFSPHRRSFGGFAVPEHLSNLLIERFGADQPSGLPARRRDNDGGRAVLARLRSMAAELAR